MSTPSPAPATVLFTDIANSTGILYRLGNHTYTEQLHGPHLETLTRVIAQHGGMGSQNTGDGVSAYFADPLQAIACAIALQTAFRLTAPAVAEETGPCRLQARMGLHIGAVSTGGVPTNETFTYAARVMQQAVAEQILLSDALHKVYQSNPALPTRAFADQYFKGVPDLQTVHELLYDGVPRNGSGSRLIGFRETEIANSYVSRPGKEAEVRDALFVPADAGDTAYRLATIRATGGMGKTRLAVTCAGQVQGECPGGVVLVPLALVTRRDPQAVAEAVLRAFDFDLVPGDNIAPLLARLRARPATLLVLDNLESVNSEGVRALLAEMLKIPQVRLLVTSQSPVGLSGQERVVSLDDGLAPDEAAQLFVLRAREHTSTAPPSAADPDLLPLMELACHIPLAIELIAAWWEVYPRVRDLRREYGEAFSFLTETPPDERVPGGPAEQVRHKSLEASLHWSWRNLGDATGGANAQAAFIAASLFADTFDLDGLQATLGWADKERTRQALTRALKASLFRVDELPAPTVRYRMHRFAQAYGRDARYDAVTAPDRLAALPTPDALRSNFIDYYLTITREHDTKVGMVDGAHSRAVLDAEWRNVQQALAYAVPMDKVKTVLLGNGLSNYFGLRSFWKEWEEALNLALVASPDMRSKASTLNSLGVVYQQQGYLDEANRVFTTALTILRKLNERHGYAMTLHNLAIIYHEKNRLEDAIKTLKEAYTIFLGLRDEKNMAHSLIGLGNVYHLQGRYDDALNDYETALHICRSMGDQVSESKILTGLGNVYQEQGLWVEAIIAYDCDLTICRELGDQHGEAHTLCNISAMYVAMGMFCEATKFAKEGLAVAKCGQDARLIQRLQIFSEHIEAACGDQDDTLNGSVCPGCGCRVCKDGEDR